VAGVSKTRARVSVRWEGTPVGSPKSASEAVLTVQREMIPDPRE
jgi:hypothetical protein